MIRFYDRQPDDRADMDIVVASEQILFDENIWDNGKEYFKHNICDYDGAVVKMLPIEGKNHKVICYAYQDDEANRELRMLRELEENGSALQFGDIFPDVKVVSVCGCNELAYRFVSYLRKQCIPVIVTGKYWKYLGYETRSADEIEDTGKMIVYAEGTLPQTGDLYQTIIRSASPEFECIDKIYEANVREGRIKDNAGEWIEVQKLLREKAVVVLGTDAMAQDAYDLLYERGIDIKGFAVWNKETRKSLLGKKIFYIDEIIYNEEELTIVNCREKGSALGTKEVEFFDYYGYERNVNFFLLKDYTDIPCSNLIHVLKGRNVWLAGEEKLCRLLADYLEDIEHGDVCVNCAGPDQYQSVDSKAIFCTVYPWYGGVAPMEDNPKLWAFRQELAASGVPYTDYFSGAEPFILIDLYRGRETKKFSIKQLRPKGFLLGRIPATSGNYFFRGILDGHPDILKWDYTPLDGNLWLYCIRLAYEKSENVLEKFKELYNEEFLSWRGADFTDWYKFEEKVKELLSLKEYFTSQELFVIFYIAYAEMTWNEKITDIGRKVIYWEPHGFPREKYSFLARWLESEKVNGQTISMHRDHIVWTGSYYKFYDEQPASIEFIRNFSAEEMMEKDTIRYEHWREFHVRFEDLKLHPQEELLEICDSLGISWSDTMLSTTRDGVAWDFGGVSDFDLKPVFNKYEETLSEFDRFRISVISSAYQKKYGYVYENCTKFSRRELQELFLKEFRFQEKLQFTDEKDKVSYYLRAYDSLRKQLWEARRHVIMDDIVLWFDAVEIGRLQEKPALRAMKNFVAKQERLVLYGTGRDCVALLESLDETEQSKLVFCDQKAADGEMVFYGKKVIAPMDLCKDYREYPILVTSSWYYKSIQYQLEEIGVSADRITCNKTSLWERK